MAEKGYRNGMLGDVGRCWGYRRKKGEKKKGEM